MRYTNAAAISPYFTLKPPFELTGAPNVFLETVKRGLDDDFSSSDTTKGSIVLRIYEAFGGHGRATLRIGRHIPVSKVVVTNLLEDASSEKEVCIFENEESVSEDQAFLTTLDFRGFEVKTVKIVLGGKPLLREEW